MTNEQLVVQIKAGIDTSDNMLALWKQMKRFITMIARKYTAYAELEDLEQEGYISLCKAVDNYNDEGCAFITYAAYWIKHGMLKYIEENGAIVRIPAHERISQQKYKRAVNALQSHCGIKPSQGEIAHYMGIGVEKVKSIEKSLNMVTVKSLDEPAAGGEGDSLGNFVPSGEDIEESVLDRVDRAQLAKILWPAVNALPELQGKVLRGRYQGRKTLDGIGSDIGVSKERVRRLEQCALRSLRKSTCFEQLSSFVSDRQEALCYRHCGASEFNRTWTSATERAAMRG